MDPSDRLTIDTSGVVACKREEAGKELRGCFEPLSAGSGISIEIIVTQNFDKNVGRILLQRRGVRIPYSSKRNEVIASAKTIPYRKDVKLAFAVILDARRFGGWESEQRGCRFVTYVHEQTHILDEITLCDDIGIDCFLSDPTAVKDTFFCLAHDIRMEYNAERTSIETYMDFLKETTPQATMNSEWHQSYVDSLANILGSLPDLVNLRPCVKSRLLRYGRREGTHTRSC